MLFHSPFSILHSQLLSGSVDIHCHLLPGVDDGICVYSKAVEALQWLKSAGISRLYLTPHVMSDYPNNSSGYLTEQFDRFTKKMENEGITGIPDLKLGAEYMLEGSFNISHDDRLLTYAGRHVLVETSYLNPPLGFINMLNGLKKEGYLPVLAHPERYSYMDRSDYLSFKAQQIKFQLNYLSLIGVYGTHVKEKAALLLKDGFYDYAGSDIHHLTWYRDNIQVTKLSKKQITQLRPLFQNNQLLW